MEVATRAWIGAAVLGAVLLVAASRAAPMELEHKLDGSEIPQKDSLVARGPAVATYDAANDTTLAVFLCAHGHCQVAVKLHGDQTSRVNARWTYLDGAGVEWAAREPIPTIAIPAGGIEFASNVSQAVPQPLAFSSPVLLVVESYGGAALVGASVGRASKARHGPILVMISALLGVLIAHSQAWGGTAEAYIVPFLVVAAGLLVALALSIVSLWRKPLRLWALVAFALALGCIAGVVLLQPMYPTCCTR